MKKILNLLKTTFTEWNSREAPRMGASLAFYSILSLAPLVILVVGICALVFGSAGAQAQIVGQFRMMVGDEGARTIETVLKSAQKPATGILASLVGLATLLFGASGVFVELRSALNTLWGIKAPDGGSGIWLFIKDRFLSFGMVLGIGFLLLISLAVSAALGTAGKFFSSLGFLPPGVWEVINFLVSLAVVAGLFALILRFVPDVRLPWSALWPGASLTAVLFTVGKTLIGMYLGKAGVGSAYGAAGSLVVLVVWIYYSAQIFFFGAMFTRVYAEAHGWKPQNAPQQLPGHGTQEAMQQRTPATPTLPPGERPFRERQETSPPSMIAKLAAIGLIFGSLTKKRRRS